MIRIPLLLLAAVLLAACATPSEHATSPSTAQEEVGRGRFFGIFGGKKDRRSSKKVVGRLDMTMTVSPLPVVLSEHRRLTVVLKLANESKRLVQLEFPTAQRIEILLKDANGRLVTQWSEDHAFAAATALVAINPGERVQYTTSISTRDLEAGKEYVLEGFFPHYDELRAREKFVPVP
jgi:hypothetical protein